MNARTLSILGGMALLAGGAALMAGAGQSAPTVAASATMGTTASEDAAPYDVDPVHSSLVFKIKHNNVANFYGRFNKVSGKFLLNAEDAAKSVLEIKTLTDSLDTNNSKRDQDLKAPDFFSAKEFTEITFVGKDFKKKGDASFEVTGDLSLRGKTKSVAVTVTETGKGKGMRGGDAAGIETTFTIKRSDFGMDYMLKGIGDDVTITFSGEGGRK